jgi:hypothetical protein
MGELSTTEKYVLAQILVCGAIDEDEFYRMNGSLAYIQKRSIEKLKDSGVLRITNFKV